MRFRPVAAAMAGFLAIALLMLSPGHGLADTKEKDGWEIDSAYNKYYNAAELDKIKATVVKVMEFTPMDGMSPGVGMIVREPDSDEDINVHIGPAWFMKPGEIGLKKGDVVKIRGCWAEINGEDVYMASKIKMGDYFSLKVRLTKDGTPFWTMNPDQLAFERASE